MRERGSKGEEGDRIMARSERRGKRVRNKKKEKVRKRRGRG